MQFQPSPEPISQINDAAEGSVDDSSIANSDLSGSAGNENERSSNASEELTDFDIVSTSSVIFIPDS